MQKRIVINKGKKYIVNCVSMDDVGPACDFGTLWMQSISDNLWYSVNLTGTSGSYANPLSIYVNPTPLTWESVGGQDFGYQLLYCYDNNQVYQTYLSGSGANVTMSISQTPWVSNSDYKPYLLLKSLTDGYFYTVSAKSGSVYLLANHNSKTWMDGGNPPNSSPYGSMYFNKTSSYLTVPASTDWAMGTGDFTAEWFQYQLTEGGPLSTYPRIFEIGSYVLDGISFGVTNESSVLYCWLDRAFKFNSVMSNYLNKWCHFAFCRSGSNLQVFKDGVKLGNTVTNTTNVVNTTSSMYIAAESGSEAITIFPGYITNLHIVKGKCLYTGSVISVPKTPIVPVSGSTKLLLNATDNSSFLTDLSGYNKIVTNVNNSASWSNRTPF